MKYGFNIYIQKKRFINQIILGLICVSVFIVMLKLGESGRYICFESQFDSFNFFLWESEVKVKERKQKGQLILEIKQRNVFIGWDDDDEECKIICNGMGDGVVVVGFVYGEVCG